MGAIAIAWLFIWYYQLPWYDTMIIALLALYPASRLDYVVVVQMMAGTFALMPGGPFQPPLGWLRTFTNETLWAGVPVVRAAMRAARLIRVSPSGPPVSATTTRSRASQVALMSCWAR